MKRKQFFAVLLLLLAGTVLTACASLIFGYGAVLKANWGISLPAGAQEIYEPGLRRELPRRRASLPRLFLRGGDAALLRLGDGGAGDPLPRKRRRRRRTGSPSFPSRRRSGPTLRRAPAGTSPSLTTASFSSFGTKAPAGSTPWSPFCDPRPPGHAPSALRFFPL